MRVALSLFCHTSNTVCEESTTIFLGYNLQCNTRNLCSLWVPHFSENNIVSYSVSFHAAQKPWNEACEGVKWELGFAIFRGWEMGFCALGLGFMKKTIEKWEWDFNLSNTGWDCELGFEKNNFLGNGIRTPPSRPSETGWLYACRLQKALILVVEACLKH